MCNHYLSDTHTFETDISGQLIKTTLLQANHTLDTYQIIPDEPSEIVNLITQQETKGCNLFMMNGGTGVSRRDTTFEAVDSMLEKRLPGFGELFRMLSYEQIGEAAMLSRATAGLYRQSLIFLCLVHQKQFS